MEDPQVEGPLNGTAPNPVTNREFAQKLGQVLGRPAWLAVPAIALRLMYGEAADVILEGQRVVPKRVLEMGFTFRFNYLEEALRDILGHAAARPE
jgi:NAD dependent epimerase/dehydratase family enzyme